MTVQHAVKVFESTGFQSAAQRLVLLEIAYRSDRKGVIRHSQTEIASDSGMSRRTVAGWYKFFEEVGIVTRDGHGRYQINMEVFDEDIAPLLATSKGVGVPVGFDDELARIKAIKQPGQGIVVRADGWPILVEM